MLLRKTLKFTVFKIVEKANFDYLKKRVYFLFLILETSAFSNIYGDDKKFFTTISSSLYFSRRRIEQFFKKLFISSLYFVSFLTQQ